ncbi:MAG: prepilin peptidase [Candidatus Binatia bacterium]
MFPYLLDSTLFLFVGLAVFFDIRERKIPNWLVLLALVAGFLINAVEGQFSFLKSLYGLGLGIGIFFIPFALGLLGAGDVKFLGAIGAILGASFIPRIAFYSVVAGGILALCSVVVNGFQFQNITTTIRDIQLFIMSRGKIAPETVQTRTGRGVNTIPYGVAIGLGTLLAVYGDPQGYWAGF